MTVRDRCTDTNPHPAHRTQYGGFGVKDCPGIPMTSPEELREERVKTGRLEGDLRSQTQAVRELRRQLDDMTATAAGFEVQRDQAYERVDELDTELGRLGRYRDAITAENAQWQAEIAHLRDLIGKYGDDGMIPAAALRKALRDGPPPVLGSPRRAQEEPDLWQYGRYDRDDKRVITYDGTPRLITPRVLRRPMTTTGPWAPATTEEPPAGCPETVWDGPYSMRCGMGGSVGVCATHGRFRPAAEPTP